MLNWFDWKEPLASTKSGRWLAGGWLVIIMLLPFHGFLSVFLGANLGGYLFWRSWKEALILSLLMAGLWFLWLYDKKLLRVLAGQVVNQLILVYVVLHLFLAIFSGVNSEAVLYALVYNLRFLGLFLVAQILGHYWKRNQANERQIQRLIIIPAIAVAGFALMQLVLPQDFLASFGYGPDTIESYVTIDNKESWVRAQSFLRGPNQLGQYLLLLLTLLFGLWLKHPSSKLSAGLLAGGVALIATYSRSAWLAFVAAIIVCLTASKNWQQWRKKILTGLMALTIFLVGLLWLAPSSESLRLIIFHDDQAAGQAAGSNDVRVTQTQKSLELIAAQPLGYGPGTAGPASFHNDDRIRINDNYYLQLTLEVGLVGLVFFLAICWIVAKNLWRQRHELMPQVLLAVFVGISLINFFLPAWAQDEISLIWWGMAGVWYKSH